MVNKAKAVYLISLFFMIDCVLINWLYMFSVANIVDYFEMTKCFSIFSYTMKTKK